MTADREAGPALDLRHRSIDEAAGDLGNLSASGTDNVLMMAARALESGPAVPQLDPLQLASFGEVHEGTKNRRLIGLHTHGVERCVSLVEGPAVPIGAGDELGDRIANVAGACHADTVQIMQAACITGHGNVLGYPWLAVCVHFLYTAIASSTAAERTRSHVRARQPLRGLVVAALIASPALAFGLS